MVIYFKSTKWYCGHNISFYLTGGSKSVASTTTTVAPTTTPETWATLATCPFTQPWKTLQCEAYLGRSQSLEDVRTALKCSGVEVDKCGKPGASGCCHGGQTSPLFHAAYKGNADILELLLKDGRSDVNLGDKNGVPPIIVATGSNRVDEVKLLLRCPKVDLTIVDQNGRTARDRAVIFGFTAIVEAIDNVADLRQAEGLSC